MLILSVMPDRTILPEWEDSQKKVSDKAIGVQRAIYSSFTRNPGSRLFYLGFYEQNDEMSSSIDYFLRFSRLFIHKLSRIPELETLRTDKKLLFKHSLILTEKRLIQQDFFVFFHFPENSRDLYYENLRSGLPASHAGRNICRNILFWGTVYALPGHISPSTIYETS